MALQSPARLRPAGLGERNFLSLRRIKGIMECKAGDKTLGEEWAEHKKAEKKLEDRHTR